jgi:hypothetical protein
MLFYNAINKPRVFKTMDIATMRDIKNQIHQILFTAIPRNKAQQQVKNTSYRLLYRLMIAWCKI